MVVSSHLKALQALELAARLGSFREAGRKLTITPAAVGQRVKALEDYLGMELLFRERGGVRATPELLAALPHLSRAFAALEEASTQLDVQRGHELHIACASDVAELWLKPRFARFRADHPRLTARINGEGDAPIRMGRVDCEITFQEVSDDALTDLLFHDFVLPLTSKENQERTSLVTASDWLEGFPLLHVDFYKDDPAGLTWKSWIIANGASRTNPERGMRFGRIARAMDAVRANAGFALCGIVLLADLLEQGEVAPLYPVSTGTRSAHAFVARFRTESCSQKHIRKFRSWLNEQGRLTNDWLSGYVGKP